MSAYPNAKVLKQFPTRYIDPEETDSASEDDSCPEFLPKPLTDIFKPKYQSLDQLQLENEKGNVFKNLIVTEKEVNFLEQVTREQSKCETWKLHRKGRLTASVFHRVLTLRDSTSPQSVISDVMGYKGTTGMFSATLWGINNEDFARKKFVEKESLKHEMFVCKKAGLVVNTKFPYLGASPDGMTECSCCGKGVVEIKCPFSHKTSTLSEAVKDPKFCLNEMGHLKRNHSYYTQIQGQLAITEAKICFFVVMTSTEVHVESIFPDPAFWDTLKSRLVDFFVKFLLPELMTRRLDVKLTADGDEAFYCSCKEPAHGRMIACENDRCNIIWYHFKCVNLKRKPAAKWFCQSCKKK